MNSEQGTPSRMVTSSRSTQDEPGSWLSVALKWNFVTVETEETPRQRPDGLIQIETLTRASIQLDLKALLGLSDQETKWCVEIIKAWWSSTGCGSSSRSRSEYSTAAKTIDGRKDNKRRIQQWACTRSGKVTTAVPLQQRQLTRQRIEELDESTTEMSKNGEAPNNDLKKPTLELDSDQAKTSPPVPPPSIHEQQQQDEEQEFSWLEIGSIVLDLVHNKVRSKLKKVVYKLSKLASVGP